MKDTKNNSLFAELTTEEAATLSGGTIPIPYSLLFSFSASPFAVSILDDMEYWEEIIGQGWTSGFGTLGGS